MRDFRENISLYLNYLMVAYAFILPLSRAGIIAVSALMVILALFDRDLKSNFLKIWETPFSRMLIIFVLFNIISLIWVSGDNLFYAMDYLIKYWYFIPLFIISLYLREDNLYRVISAFILGMFISEIISYGIFFEIWSWKNVTPDNPSPFMHHIEYSTFLAFTALLLLNRIFNEGSIKSKLFYSIFFTTILGNLFLTNGRTGQIAFIIGLVLLGFISFKNKFKAFFITFLISIIVLSLAYKFSNTFHQRVSIGKSDIVNVLEKQNYCSSWGARLGFWIIATDITERNPLIGVGIKDNMSEFHHLVNSKYPQMQCINYLPHFHNQYLQILTSTGLIGLLIFLLMLLRLLMLEIKSTRYKNIKIIFLSVLIFGFFAEPLLHAQFSMLFFSLIAGTLLAQYRIENEK
jgi:O-antigen ligase